jgi:hypothetical protein
MKKLALTILLSVYAFAYPAVVFVTTTNAPDQSLKNFLIDASKVADVADDFRMIEVYRGIDEDRLPDLLKTMIKESERNATIASVYTRSVSISVDTDWLDLIGVADVAPAFGLFECKGELFPENCELLAKIIGDISLREFLALAAEKKVPHSARLLKAFGESNE